MKNSGAFRIRIASLLFAYHRQKNIALIRGDGIGPEIIAEAQKILISVAKKFSHEFSFTEVEAGGVSIDKYGLPLTDENLQKCLASDAVLLGSVGEIGRASCRERV